MSENILNESSPSVQAHLGIIQNIIQRMASNSSACKTWCITIVSAILAMLADKQNTSLVWVAIFPTVLFGCLDIYYLSLEKGFRNAYNSFIKKLHNHTLTAEDLYTASPSGCLCSRIRESLVSFSVLGFYLPLTLLALFVNFVVHCRSLL